MTNEEHINGLKVIKPFLQKKMLEINYEGMGELDAKEIGETIDAAIEAVGKSDKYRWHDLRKNPEDLPTKEYKSYLVYTSEYKYDVADYYGDVSSVPVWSISQYDFDVYEWREIEPFEEEDE